MDLVVLKKWGTYKKGDTLKDVHESTANALIKHGVVEEKKTKPKN